MSHPILDPYSLKTFKDSIKHHFNIAKSASKTPPSTIDNGETDFVPISHLIPGQDEISFYNAYRKLQTKYRKLGISWDAKASVYSLAQDKGRSLLALTKPIKVLASPKGYVVIDGHHHVTMSLFVGATRAPIFVVGHLPSLSATSWNKLNKGNYVFFSHTTPEKQAISPITWSDLKDNPNRYLASLTSIKAKIRYKKGEVSVSDKRGHKDAAWIKINEGFPFVELYIAKALSHDGIVFDEKWEKRIPEKVRKRIRESIEGAALEKNAPLPIHKLMMVSSDAMAEKILASDQFLARKVTEYLTDHDMPLNLLNGTLHRLLSTKTTTYLIPR